MTKMTDKTFFTEKKKKLTLIKSLFLVLLVVLSLYHFHKPKTLKKDIEIPKCPTVDIYRPSNYESNKELLHKIINDPVYRNISAGKMIRSIQCDTSSYDDEPEDVENNLESFERFNVFHKQLRDDFPLLHETLKLHNVNHFGLVYIWQGSDSSLQPLLLMAHQDVSPISEASLDQWIHPPFAGVYDGKFMYGRGSADCKNLLIGQMEAIEELIKIGFKPRRTIILSYGYDEELTGVRNKNPAFIEEMYGTKSMFAIMDEGGVSLQNISNSTMAIVGTGEKGYIDVSISIQKKGGHSSVPQDHTAIGIMGSLIVEIEDDKFETHFTELNPTFYQYVCLAENSVDIDAVLKHDILYSQFDDDANSNIRNFINSDRLTSYAIKTTQALDIINGGVKVNALPEFVELRLNSRIALEENITFAYEKFVKNVETIAKKYDLGLNVEYPYNKGEDVVILPPTDVGVFSVKSLFVLEPSPITPVGDKKWKVFAGTTRHIYEELAYPEIYENSEEQVIVTPGLGTGNTDTRYYWRLSDYIYRYRPGVLPSVTANSHGINEYIEFDGHLQIIAFTFEYILSVDELDD
ncbi:hypothetical protein C6P40_000765 [Pichia californica]|uniref:Peptidase M20 dimerisation domain-containing protein n=1 Tax=Pichia californica TaxID=460514 RepID=A0A9P6WMT1_9ASCO|nr:hypothetical protein C6P40_000765 [[Candida] californica]